MGCASSNSRNEPAKPAPAAAASPVKPTQLGSKSTDPERTVLVNLLNFGTGVEHALMCSYLYTAYSMKTRPEEFQENGDRAAVEFELARDMRKEIIDVAVEEMFHLHIVQCLLRGLGELPQFILPTKNASTNWQWPLNDWVPLVPGGQPGKQPVMVPLLKFSPAALTNFMAWESPDSLQVIDPVTFEAVWEQIRVWELNYRVNMSLYSCTDPTIKANLFPVLYDLYNGTSQLAARSADHQARLKFVRSFPTDLTTFSSINDLYYGSPTLPAYGILPLYKQAWDKGWMSPTHGDGKDLFGEINGNVPQNGFYQYLPVAPVFAHGRDMVRIKTFNMQNPANNPAGNPHQGGPTYNFQTVSDLVTQVVGEGEGFTEFPALVTNFLAKDSDVNQYCNYYIWLLWYNEQLPGPFPGGAPQTTVVPPAAPPAPPIIDDAERIRQCHLYRFGHMHKVVSHESAVLGNEWQIFRDSITSTAPEINNLRTGLPLYFNGMYLVLFTWLARFYASNSTWESDDTPAAHRRTSLESLATWPLMSMAMRPLLEIAGWFGTEVSNYLFLQDGTYLPTSLPDYQSLLSTYTQAVAAGGATQAQNNTMDGYSLNIIGNIADWAQSMYDALVGSANLNATQQLVITQALKNVIAMREIVLQYPFRVAGGFSDILPNSEYIKEHAATMYAYEENPNFPPTSPIPTSAVKAIRRAARSKTATAEQRQLAEQLPATPVNAVFQNTLVLRLRYTGFFRLAMPTDPDPNRDTVGCTGTNMLHPADVLVNGPQAQLLRYATSRADDPVGIARAPFDASIIPACEVKVLDASIQVGGFVNATLTNLHLPGQPPSQPPAGPPNSQWIWPEWTLSNLSDPISIMDHNDMAAIGTTLVNYEKRPGGDPFHWCGENHVICQDGEPIDPYILSFSDKGNPATLFQRSVYGSTTMEQMTPLQRTETFRMCPLDDASGNQLYPNMVFGPNAYDWMKFRAPENLQRLGWTTSQDAYQFCLTYLSDRADQLIRAANKLDPTDPTYIVQFVSFLDRAYKATDRRDQYESLLRFGLFWGHTVSGDLVQPTTTPKFWQFLEQETLMNFTFKTDGDRTLPNSRWMTSQVFGLQDYDALSTYTAGTMYIPITAMPSGQIFVHANWTWDKDIYDDLSQFAVQFNAPFWTPYTVNPPVRTASVDLQLSPPITGLIVTETQVPVTDAAFMAPFAKVTQTWGDKYNMYGYTQTGLPNVGTSQAIIGCYYSQATKCTMYAWCYIISAATDIGAVTGAQLFAQWKALMLQQLTSRYGQPMRVIT